jgi:hypothetical protein
MKLGEFGGGHLTTPDVELGPVRPRITTEPVAWDVAMYAPVILS